MFTMKGISYKFTKNKKVLCLTILFFIVIFILMGISCFSVYREDKKIVEKEISEINAFQKNQKLKPLFINQTQQLYHSVLTELSTSLPTIDTSESSRIKPGCDESVQKFLDISRAIAPTDGISLDYINALFIHLSSTSSAYSGILRACLNYQTKQMIVLKKYNIQVLKRLINYMLSKETFGEYIDSVIVLNNVLKFLKETDIGYTQSFFVIYKEELQTFNDALNQIVIFMKSKKETLLRLLEYLTNQDYINLLEVTTMIEGNENEKQEYSIFIAFMRTVQVIPVLIMESTLKDFLNINMVNGSNGINVELKGKYKGTKLENKLENFNKKASTMIGMFFGIFRKIFYLNKTKKSEEIVYDEIEIYELAESMNEAEDSFIGSLDISFKHTQ